MSRKQLLIVLGAVISLVFLYLSLRGQEWGEIAASFAAADYRWLIPAGVLILADYAFRAWRWGIILKPAAGQRISPRILFPVLLLGFAANNILPARAGEVWRMWGLAQRTSVRKTVALSTLVVERVFDGFTLVFLLGVAGSIHQLTEQAQWIETVALFLFGAVLVGLLMFLFLEDFTLRLAAWVMWPVPEGLRDRLLDVMARFAKGLHALRRPQSLIGIIGTSLLAWGSQALSFAMILLAFNATANPAELITVSILMLALINLIIMIPAGPGNVGTFEGAGVLALTISGIAISSEQALAVVIVTHMLQWFLVTGLGVLIAAREGISLAGLNAGPQTEMEV
jgi:glycosyltransferase 2 family protein